MVGRHFDAGCVLLYRRSRRGVCCLRGIGIREENLDRKEKVLVVRDINTFLDRIAEAVENILTQPTLIQ